MWNPGDQVALRGIYNAKPWYAQSVLIVKDTPAEIVLLLTPGAECLAPWGYIHQKHGESGTWNRWQECLNAPWKLETYRWHTNRFLILLEPAKFYATILIWNDASNEFLGYYINFQLPFTRSHCGFDTLDLELDIVIEPNFLWKWKDVDEYQQGIQMGVLQKEWAEAIEQATPEILSAIEQRSYPFNSDWLNWKTLPGWTAPNLPPDWNR